MSTMQRVRRWTIDEVRALGTVTDVETAGQILGLNRTTAYNAARQDRFPVPVLKVNQKRWVVPVPPLLRVLGVDGEAGE